MAITADGWFDWMRREPGPPDKRYSETNRVDFYVGHSAVGYYGGWSSRLFSRERDAEGRYTAYAAVSAHGWIPYDGAGVQHYPLTASCWTSGSRAANTRGVAFEMEGGAPDNESEPLAQAQKQALACILAEIAAWKRVEPSYWRRPHGPQDLNATLYEHRDCTRFGSAPTACPSNRIDWDEILSLLGGAGAVPAAPAGDGWHSEPPYQVLYSYAVPGTTRRRRAAGTHLEAVRRPLPVVTHRRERGCVLVGGRRGLTCANLK